MIPLLCIGDVSCLIIDKRNWESNLIFFDDSHVMITVFMLVLNSGTCTNLWIFDRSVWSTGVVNLSNYIVWRGISRISPIRQDRFSNAVNMWATTASWACTASTSENWRSLATIVTCSRYTTYSSTYSMILPHGILQAWKNLQVLPPTNHSGDARFFRWVKLKPSVVTVNYISTTTKRFLLRLQPYVLWWPVPGEGGWISQVPCLGGWVYIYPPPLVYRQPPPPPLVCPVPPGKDLGRPVMHIPQKGHGTRHAHPSLNGMTDARENITFPQIR